MGSQGSVCFGGVGSASFHWACRYTPTWGLSAHPSIIESRRGRDKQTRPTSPKTPKRRGAAAGSGQLAFAPLAPSPAVVVPRHTVVPLGCAVEAITALLGLLERQRCIDVPFVP